MPQTTKGTSPAQLLMGHQLRSHLGLLLSSVADKVQLDQLKFAKTDT